MRRSLRMLAVLAFLTGSLAPVLIALTPGTASAGTCTAGLTSCSVDGTLNVTGGSLTLTAPSTLTWNETLNGLDQTVVDTTGADEGYTLDDATGTGDGWNVTMSATTFTSGSGDDENTLANSGTLSTTGSVTSDLATSGPSAACETGSTCITPTNSLTYPVAITTAASTPETYVIYEAAIGTGLGEIAIGGSSATAPAGWWLSIPADVYYGTGAYTSTITLAVVSGP